VLSKGIAFLDPKALIDIAFLIATLELYLLALRLLDWLMKSGRRVQVASWEIILTLVRVVVVEAVRSLHKEGGGLEAQFLPRVSFKNLLRVRVP